MTMFKCVECGHLFESGEEKRWTEPHGEKMSGCPCCSGDYEEAKMCEFCEEYVCAENEKYCEECKQKMLNMFVEFLKNFDKKEKELISYLWEEEMIDVQKMLKNIDNCDNNNNNSVRV